MTLQFGMAVSVFQRVTARQVFVFQCGLRQSK